MTEKFKFSNQDNFILIKMRIKRIVSLNSRPYTYLIDPNVDLTTQKDPLFPVPWILPLKE